MKRVNIFQRRAACCSRMVANTSFSSVARSQAPPLLRSLPAELAEPRLSSFMVRVFSEFNGFEMVL